MSVYGSLKTYQDIEYQLNNRRHNFLQKIHEFIESSSEIYLDTTSELDAEDYGPSTEIFRDSVSVHSTATTPVASKTPRHIPGGGGRTARSKSVPRSFFASDSIHNNDTNSHTTTSNNNNQGIASETNIQDELNRENPSRRSSFKQLKESISTSVHGGGTVGDQETRISEPSYISDYRIQHPRLFPTTQVLKFYCLFVCVCTLLFTMLNYY